MAVFKQDTLDNDSDVCNGQTIPEAVTTVKSSEEGDDFFIGNNPDSKSEKVVKPKKLVNKSKSPLDEIKPFLKPSENSKEMLPIELFMMVKKRMYSFDNWDIYDEWNRVQQNDKYREAYVTATEIYNDSVRQRKTKILDKSSQSTSKPHSH